MVVWSAKAQINSLLHPTSSKTARVASVARKVSPLGVITGKAAPVNSHRMVAFRDKHADSRGGFAFTAEVPRS